VPSASSYPPAQARHLSAPAPVHPEHTLSQAAKDKKGFLIYESRNTHYTSYTSIMRRLLLQTKCAKKRGNGITRAGVRAVRVHAVLLFSTRRSICGALVYICKSTGCSEGDSGGHGTHFFVCFPFFSRTLYADFILLVLVTNASLLVIVLPAVFALITVLTGRPRAGFAGSVARCKRTRFQHSLVFLLCVNKAKRWRQVTTRAGGPACSPDPCRRCTCAQGEGVVPHFVEVAADAVEAGVPLIGGVTAALSIAAASPVAIALSISVTRPLRASHTGFEE